MIDLDKVLAMCLVLLAGGLLVLSTYLVTMKVVSDDIESWHELALHSQDTAAQCISVLDQIDADMLSLLHP